MGRSPSFNIPSKAERRPLILALSVPVIHADTRGKSAVGLIKLLAQPTFAPTELQGHQLSALHQRHLPWIPSSTEVGSSEDHVRQFLSHLLAYRMDDFGFKDRRRPQRFSPPRIFSKIP
jgi:hypothetical protein